jgi:MFS family permease
VGHSKSSDAAPGPSARWASLGLLIVAAILSFVDRQIVSLLVGPIKADLGLTDVEISLVQGLAFALFYAIAALPFGMLVDRVSRRWVLALGIIGWSIMTAVCGFARSFWELFVARMGVGIGEASLGPAAHSLIGDLFRGARLPLAMSLYGLGVAAGAAIATIVGGQVAAWVETHPGAVVPGLGLVEGWRLAFSIVAAPGFIVAAAVFLIIPAAFARAQSQPRSAEAAAAAQAAEGFGAFIRRAAGPGALILAGLACATAANYAALSWAPAFLQRSFGLSAGQAGLALGLLIFTAALPGGLIWSLVATRMARRSQTAALVVLAASTAAAAPFAVIGYVADTLPIAIGGLYLATFLGAGLVGLGPAIVQAATPSQARGRVSAIQLLVTSVFGMSAGPFAVAALTDYVFVAEARVGEALAISVAVFSLAAGAALAAARRPYEDFLGAGAAHRETDAPEAT